MAYKRFDIIIEAFNKLGWPLKIIGRGPDHKRLEKMADSNIEFKGRVSDEDLAKIYAEAKAFLFPQEEDFGIVAIEAMASGKPIIAFKGGDIVEHINEGEDGVFFEKQTAEAVIEALNKFNNFVFDKYAIQSKAEKFDREIFKFKIKDYVESALK
jgi:glycosyltransferase involved in cell wall biosynthesis